MIEVPRVAIFTVFRQDKFKPYDNTHLYAEVVLLDKTFSSNHPLLYQLHLDALGIEDPLFNSYATSHSLQQHVELISGEISQIDKQKKVIILSDMSTVRYKYLIVMNGAIQDALSDIEKDEALAAGLSTLQDALKIKQHFNRLPSHSAKEGKLPSNGILPLSNDNIARMQALLKQSNLSETSKSSLQPRLLLEVLM